MIGALAPWYGSKRTLAPQIVRQLGPHRVYWEVFCGSCAVLFAKEPCHLETVNDLHGDLINLALVVQEETTALELYARVSRCLCHESLVTTAKKILTERECNPDRPDVDRAYWYLVFSWMGINGIGGTSLSNAKRIAVCYADGGESKARAWGSMVASIPVWHRRLANVQILHRDAFEVLSRIEDATGFAIYVDPPYLEKRHQYIHDFASADHQRLAELLRRFKRARVVVSYYNHEALANLYPGWTVLACPTTKSLGRDKGGKTPEVLLINGEPHGQEDPLFQVMEDVQPKRSRE